MITLQMPEMHTSLEITLHGVPSAAYSPHGTITVSLASLQYNWHGSPVIRVEKRTESCNFGLGARWVTCLGRSTVAIRTICPRMCDYCTLSTEWSGMWAGRWDRAPYCRSCTVYAPQHKTGRPLSAWDDRIHVA